MTRHADAVPDLHPALDPTPLSVGRFAPGWWPAEALPGFLAVVAAPDETTVVGTEQALRARTDAIAVEHGWVRITFAGPLPWELVGFLADVSRRLADARVSFTSMSGFTTDHVLVRAAQAAAALAVLRGEDAPALRPDVTNP
jgi:uncharacterized protein